jgi:hypothetical protein
MTDITADNLSWKLRRLSAHMVDGEYQIVDAAAARIAKLEAESVELKLNAGLAAVASEDATLLTHIRQMCGYVENGSGQSIKIGQDDATRDWSVYIDNKFIAYGPTFKAAIKAAFAKVPAEGY